MMCTGADSGSSLDQEMVDVFLATSRSFISPINLFTLVVKRFRGPTPVSEADRTFARPQVPLDIRCSQCQQEAISLFCL